MGKLLWNLHPSFSINKHEGLKERGPEVKKEEERREKKKKEERKKLKCH